MGMGDGGGGLPVGCPNSKGEKVSANLNLNPFRENGGIILARGHLLTILSIIIKETF
jgi:hypothetical protein